MLLPHKLLEALPVGQDHLIAPHPVGIIISCIESISAGAHQVCCCCIQLMKRYLCKLGGRAIDIIPPSSSKEVPAWAWGMHV